MFDIFFPSHPQPGLLISQSFDIIMISIANYDDEDYKMMMMMMVTMILLIPTILLILLLLKRS